MPSTLPSCHSCGSQDIEYNEARGETLCCHCGVVLEENAMVEGIQFMESSGGSMTMVGQFVPSNSSGRRIGNTLVTRENRELILQRGYYNMQRIADHLRLPNQHMESAQRVYLMAVQRNFTMGRNSLHVAAACLYAICRRERTPHMLIDFSDILQYSAKSLGQVFMKLLRLLHLQVPHIDPSLFMERFASQMPLGNKVHKVSSTGVRLIQAMTRDWISTGRRPTGLCGSALLIAARYHGFKINAEEIAQIVRIGSPTLVKRLLEFKKTSTAQLTSEEFESSDVNTLPILNGPPCLYAKRKNMIQDDATNTPLRLPERDSVEQFDAASVSSNTSEWHTETQEKDSGTVENDMETIPLRKSFYQAGITLPISEEQACNQNPTPQDIATVADKLLSAIDNQFEPSTSQSFQHSSQESLPNFINESTEDSIDPLLNFLSDIKTFSSSQIVETKKIEYLQPQQSVVTESMTENNVESLSDVDDEAVDSILLDENERNIKTLIWDEMTKDIMPEVYRRIKARKRRIKTEQNKGNKKRMTTQKKNRTHNPEAVSPEESVRIALRQSGKGIVNRINDDVLRSLFLHPSNSNGQTSTLTV